METKLTPALERLVAHLESLPELPTEALSAALQSQITIDDVADWVHFDAANYRRNLVIRHPKFELRIICWLPNQRTSLHGHDGSACAFRILKGLSTEIRLGQPDHQWPVGAVVTEEGVNLVHQVTNLEQEPLVSLNAYAPPLPVDQPPLAYRGRHVVIIGGGVSGASLAIHLLAEAKHDLKISFVERRQWLGRGAAYGTTDPAFRLNVPAGRMSLFPNRPRDFIEWASRHGAPVDADDLLPRQLFGAYVEDRLATAITNSSGKVWFHRSEAIAATKGAVQLADGTCLVADAVVLATGNQLPSAPPAIPTEVLRSSRVIGDPWSDGAMTRVARDEDVLIFGTGLTAVDVMLALRDQGHQGRVLATSRRGLLPRAHLHPNDPRKQAVQIDPATIPTEARLLARWLRDQARTFEAQGIGWQCVIDALRPHTAGIWAKLAPPEKQRFMRKLRPYWDAVRHRAPPDALDAVEAWRKEGTLQIVPGTISSVNLEGERVEVKIAPRGGGELVKRHFDRIVLCTGPETDVRRWTGALFKHLLREKYLRADALGLGVLTDGSGRVLDQHDAPSSWLFTIGGLQRPRLWETTAVPDLVRQAVALAETLKERT